VSNNHKKNNVNTPIPYTEYSITEVTQTDLQYTQEQHTQTQHTQTPEEELQVQQVQQVQQQTEQQVEQVAEQVEEVAEQVEEETSSTIIEDTKYTESTLSSLTDETSDIDINYNEKRFRKYTLKPKEFVNKNICIVGNEKSSNVQILSDILHKLSMLIDISKLYDTSIYIITKSEHRKIYKRLLLDNPYLYFTDIHIHKTTDDLNLSPSKKVIYIVDVDNFDISKFTHKNIQIIRIINKIVSGLNELYESLGNNKLLLCKLDKLKLNQKLFYKKVVKKLSRKVFADFEDYYTSLNNENLDAKYIVFKNLELRYN
jgi:hypothetical protein